MTSKQFYFAFSEAVNYDDADAFISDLALSSMFMDNEDENAVPETELLEELSKIWEVSHMSIRDIRNISGLTQQSFCEKFLIPKRTLENWESTGKEKRNCPSYVKLLLSHACGIINFGKWEYKWQKQKI